MVAAGVLSPAAVDMDPDDALEQHAEACALTVLERQQLADRFGLGTIRLRVDEVQVGDLVDVGGLVVVLVVVNDVNGSALYTPKGRIRSDAGRSLLVRLGPNRCGSCGQGCDRCECSDWYEED